MGSLPRSESQAPTRVQPMHHDRFHDAQGHGKNESPLRRKMGNYNDEYKFIINVNIQELFEKEELKELENFI